MNLNLPSANRGYLMIANIIAASLAASSPANMIVDDYHVARCTRIVLEQNGLTETGARRLQVNESVVLDGDKVVLSEGDTVWGACRSRLQRIEFRHECQEATAASVELERDTAELIRAIDAIEPHSRAVQLNLEAMRLGATIDLRYVQSAARIIEEACEAAH